MPDEGATGPMTRAERMGQRNIGSAKDALSAEDRRMLNPILEPVSGEEVGMQKREEKVYKKKMASGGYTRAADGCCQKGKTRGKMV